ncbi:hypothetical protein MTR_2g094000 [Medicago truncatula]|uniref:Uncharacterized protein n=1 Tax=Medicago truncatula TaxID=3880 RepID=G7IRP8_MEDTR|nr:hypothetical protein MTR_2g094000 [Medicago truncatula]
MNSSQMLEILDLLLGIKCGDVASKSLGGLERLAHCRSRRSQDSPTIGIRALIRLDGERKWDPSLDQASDVGDSHLRGGYCWESSVNNYVPHRLKMEEMLDI